MKNKKKILAILLIGLVLVLAAGGFVFYKVMLDSEEVVQQNYSDEELTVNEELYEQTDSNIHKLTLPKVQFDQDFSFYNDEVQTTLNDKVTSLKNNEHYSISEPLLIMNPFGTLTNGLYVYFEDSLDGKVTYTIDTKMRDGTKTFSRTAKNAAEEDGVYEFQMIGLVPGQENKVTMELTNGNGETKDEYTFEIDMPRNESTYPNRVNKQDGKSEKELTEGLYYTLGTNGYEGYTHFFDNEGIVRLELKSNDYRLDRIIPYDDNLLFAVDKHRIASMNSLGQIEDMYILQDYVQHHDFSLGADDELLVLASKTGLLRYQVEDRLISIDLETGDVSETLDFGDLLEDYESKTTPNRKKFGFIPREQDWLHLNSIEKMDDDQYLFSSREASTIFQVNNLHDDPKLDYLIGQEDVWKDTDYEDNLLEQVGDFPIQAGQHSLNYTEDDELDDGSYYIEFFNNNYWWYQSRPDYEGSVNDEYSGNRLPNEKDQSYYYKYLVDENEGTYELVDSISLPYSSIVSSVQPYNDNIITNSGMANNFREYDSDDQLIASFDYSSGEFIYRIFKDDFEGFWFE